MTPILNNFMNLSRKSKPIIDRLSSINPWHLLWISILGAELFTFGFSTIQSEILWGSLPNPSEVILGIGDALGCDIILAVYLILVLLQMSALKQELKVREEKEKQFRELAFYDSLTGLSNRAMLKEVLGKAIKAAELKNISSFVGILYIDLDDFKRINDTLGHEFGDEVLRIVTQRLLISIRRSDYLALNENSNISDIVSRLGGDEFTILLTGLNRHEDAGKIASRIENDLSDPFLIKGREFFLTASIVIAVYPNDGRNVQELIKNADVAMYYAKSSGKNNYQYYSAAMNLSALEVFTLEHKLYKAIEKNEMFLLFQPKKSIKENRIVGTEALLRWKPEGSDIIMPSQFIGIAEQKGLIINIGTWALRNACTHLKEWHKAGYRPFTVSVNVSSRQLDQKNLVEIVSRALIDSGLEGQCLELEITESAVMRDPEGSLKILKALKEAGVRLSIDDFGTGYSSLNYLRMFPLDSLKIDKSFIANIGKSKSDEVIVKTVVNMAHGLNLTVVAEGVESEEQLDFLMDCGCDEIQGYLISRPAYALEITRLLKPINSGAEKIININEFKDNTK